MTHGKAVVAALVLGLLQTAVHAVDARERGFISRGTKEGEVLQRIGKPDHEALVRTARGQLEEKTWTYFPDPRDPQTLTIFTLRGGVVVEIERKISR